MTLEQLFAGRNMDIPASKRRMEELMATEGLPYGDRTMTYNSRLAQELAKWAETQAGGEKIHDALFRGYFVGNINLAKVENLAAIAESIGLSRSVANAILLGRDFRTAVDEDWDRSRHRAITGVPTFVLGEQMTVGAQPYEVLEGFLLSAGVHRRERVD